MPLFSQHLQKVLVFDPEKALATTGAFIDQKKDSPHSHGYQVFLVSEIRSNDHTQNQLFIQHIQERFSSFFASREEPMSESLFEEGLHSINKAIPNLISDFSPDWLDRLTLIAGTVFSNMILFSQVGEGTLLLIHGSRITDISTQPTRVNPLKVFSDVLTGKLEDKDTVFLSTSNFLDYFSQEKIRRIVEEHHEDSIAKGFDHYLIQAPATSAFAALTVTIQQAKPTTVESYIQSQQTEPHIHERVSSMEELIEREQTTEEIMSPKLLPLMKKRIRQFFRSLKFNFRKYVQRKPARISPILKEADEKIDAEVSMPQHVRSSQRKEWMKHATSSTSTSISKMRDVVARLFQKIKTVKVSRPLFMPQLGEMQKKQQRSLLAWFRKLSQKQRILFVVGVLLVAAFAESIVLIGNTRENNKQLDLISSYTTQVSQHEADIRAANLYGDDPRIAQAVADLQEIQKKIPSTKNNKTLLERIGTAIIEGQQRLQKIRTVSEPKQVADLTTLDLGTTSSGLEYLDPSLIALFGGKKQIIKVQKSSGTSEQTTDPSDSPPLFLVPSASKFLVFHQDLTLKEYSPATKGLTSLTLTVPGEAPNISAGTTYLGRLYLLDVSQNKLQRFTRSGNAFGTPTSWIQDSSIKLAGATSIAIDGSVYIGYNDGSIIKLLQGKKTDFTSPTLLEALSSIHALTVSPTNDRLYVLENGKHRILTLKKDGTLVEQIVLPSLQIIDGFTVDEKNKILYVISGSKMYSADLTPVK